MLSDPPQKIASNQHQVEATPNPMPPDVSVVILTYNIREMALDCLESVVQASEGLRVEIIVSDNGSTDGTVEAIRQKYPNVRIIENKANLGFSGGNNRGIEVSTGRHVLVLNPDTVVDKDALRLTMEYAENHPECGMVGCRVLNPDGTVQRSWFAKWTLFQAIWTGLGLQQILPLNRINGQLTFSKKAPKQVVRVDRILGCFMWMRREVIDQVGRFDERFFLYCEEEDLCQRIRNQGLEVHYYPEAQIVHFGGQSTRHLGGKERIEANISKTRWVKKHRSPGTVLIFRLVWSCALLIRAALRGGLGVFKQYHRKVAVAEWKSVGAIWKT